jgi:hypothetical protein
MRESDQLCMQTFYDAGNARYATAGPRVVCKKVGETVCENGTDNW